MRAPVFPPSEGSSATWISGYCFFPLPPPLPNCPRERPYSFPFCSHRLRRSCPYCTPNAALESNCIPEIGDTPVVSSHTRRTLGVDSCAPVAQISIVQNPPTANVLNAHGESQHGQQASLSPSLCGRPSPAPTATALPGDSLELHAAPTATTRPGSPPKLHAAPASRPCCRRPSRPSLSIRPSSNNSSNSRGRMGASVPVVGYAWHACAVRSCS
jgi:hypothetical protein